VTNQGDEPKTAPWWWEAFRQSTMFVVGIFLILFAALTHDNDIPLLVMGAVLIGLVPAERIVKRLR
jgi:hypothetical protein